MIPRLCIFSSFTRQVIRLWKRASYKKIINNNVLIFSWIQKVKNISSSRSSVSVHKIKPIPRFQISLFLGIPGPRWSFCRSTEYLFCKIACMHSIFHPFLSVRESALPACILSSWGHSDIESKLRVLNNYCRRICSKLTWKQKENSIIKKLTQHPAVTSKQEKHAARFWEYNTYSTKATPHTQAQEESLSLLVITK